MTAIFFILMEKPHARSLHLVQHFSHVNIEIIKRMSIHFPFIRANRWDASALIQLQMQMHMQTQMQMRMQINWQ